MKERNIERMRKVIERNLFRTGGNLNYDRLCACIIRLADGIAANDDHDESLWYLGEGSECTLDEFIVGAYWHFTEWHGGERSTSYKALCSLDCIFSPGMSTPERDDLTYRQLEQLAQRKNNHD